MKDIKELEEYSKKIGLLDPKGSLKKHYRYWETASIWKADEMINLIKQTEHRKFRSVLEVGCGYGMVIQRVSDYWNIPQVAGIDQDKLVLKMAKKISPNCSYINIDALNLPFPDDSFDLIILSDIIEHFDHPELLLKEARRVSTYSIFKIPLEKCLVNIGRRYGRKDGSGHLFSLDEKSTIDLITRTGFQIIDKKSSQPPDTLWSGDRFNRFKLLAPVLRFTAKFLQDNTPAIYNWIFGKTLFVFCINRETN